MKGNQKGITLVALVITIIVLIILAAVSINLVLGENGVMQRAQTGAQEYNRKAAQESLELKIAGIDTDSFMKNGRSATLQELAIALDNDKDIEYVVTTSRVAATEPIDIGDAEEIYTKLSEYSYEFGVDRDLKISKVDGVLLTSGGGNNGNNLPTLVSQITSDNYGDSVNYSVTVNGVTLDNWKIFYKDEDKNEVIMIYNDYLPNSTGIAAGAGLNTRGDYIVSSSKSRADLINKLKDESKWSSLIRSDLTGKATATGAVDLETWVNSWNAKGYQKLYTANKTGMSDDIGWGYYVGTSENPTSTYQDVSSNAGYTDTTLYFPYKSIQSNSNGYHCSSYWLASPCAYDTNFVKTVIYNGYVDACSSSFIGSGICPAVYLTSDVKGTFDETLNAWIIE